MTSYLAGLMSCPGLNLEHAKTPGPCAQEQTDNRGGGGGGEWVATDRKPLCTGRDRTIDGGREFSGRKIEGGGNGSGRTS